MSKRRAKLKLCRNCWHEKNVKLFRDRRDSGSKQPWCIECEREYWREYAKSRYAALKREHAVEVSG